MAPLLMSGSRNESVRFISKLKVLKFDKRTEVENSEVKIPVIYHKRFLFQTRESSPSTF